jgi:hypothetical protein
MASHVLCFDVLRKQYARGSNILIGGASVVAHQWLRTITDI